MVLFCIMDPIGSDPHLHALPVLIVVVLLGGPPPSGDPAMETVVTVASESAACDCRHHRRRIPLGPPLIRRWPSSTGPFTGPRNAAAWRRPGSARRTSCILKICAGANVSRSSMKTSGQAHWRQGLCVGAGSCSQSIMKTSGASPLEMGCCEKIGGPTHAAVGDHFAGAAGRSLSGGAPRRFRSVRCCQRRLRGFVSGEDDVGAARFEFHLFRLLAMSSELATHFTSLTPMICTSFLPGSRSFS